MDKLWVRDYGDWPIDTEIRTCHQCEAEFNHGARIVWDPNKVRSEGRPGVAYLCTSCQELLMKDDPAVVATVTQRLNQPTAEFEPTVARIAGVHTADQTVDVKLGDRVLEHCKYLVGSYPSPVVGDLVEMTYLARDWAEEADMPVADDEWIVQWKLPKPIFRARPDGGVDVEFP